MPNPSLLLSSSILAIAGHLHGLTRLHFPPKPILANVQTTFSFFSKFQEISIADINFLEAGAALAHLDFLDLF